MPKILSLFVCLLIVPVVFASVNISTPSNGGTYQGSVPFSATASSSCNKGVASMGVYTAPGVLTYVVNGSSLNTSLNLSEGTYNTTVEEWDYCGGASTTPVTVTVTSGGKSGVYVTSPANNSTVGSPVNFTATASSSCQKGVASMGIYTAPNQLAYVVNGGSMNYNLSLSPGTYNATVEEWDYCGGAATTPVKITVNGGGGGSGGSGGGSSFSSVQANSGWQGYGQSAPTYVDCSPSPCDGISFWMKQGISSPSMDGKAAEYYVGGTTDYGDTLWTNHLIGSQSSEGMPDNNHTLVPTLTTFTYDVYFYGTDLSLSEALEFDINQFFNSKAFIFGHECVIAGGVGWEVWNAAAGHWVTTGIPCKPLSNSWNHLTIKVQRTSSNQLNYQSITLNGVTNNLNWTYSPGSAPSDWYGITINYQQDGNEYQQPYDIYLDELTFTYQ